MKTYGSVFAVDIVITILSTRSMRKISSYINKQWHKKHHKQVATNYISKRDKRVLNIIQEHNNAGKHYILSNILICSPDYQSMKIHNNHGPSKLKVNGSIAL